MKGNVKIIATPIGNLKDFSFWAVEELKKVDVILCEDTRHSQILLNNYEIKKPLESFHKFNYAKKIGSVVQRLQKGISFAIISDAGMPGICDTGSEIMGVLRENEIEVTVISGACALINAFVLSGFSAPFTFFGFLPEKDGKKRQTISEFKHADSSLIFYCSPHSILDDLKMLYEELGNRRVFIANELTKKFEKQLFTNLLNAQLLEPRGEYVVIVEGEKGKSEDLNELTIKEHFDYYVTIGYSKNDAIKQVAKDRNVVKNEIYKQLI